ncbi:MAG: MmcQ/YjbR family DNA-binding protein [Armatimonadetes bacterium]|nr:MmcQ/YjbR family DNA-binding protein [Anaerolineae bacterium]
MDLKTLRNYCANKPGTVEEYPFGEETLVFKVVGKMFALLALDHRDEPPVISLKCDPALAEILRNIYDAVQPGYHLNKKHWNTVTVDGSIPDDEVYDMVDQSYKLVTRGLKKEEREQLKNAKS